MTYFSVSVRQLLIAHDSGNLDVKANAYKTKHEFSVRYKNRFVKNNTSDMTQVILLTDVLLLRNKVYTENCDTIIYLYC